MAEGMNIALLLSTLQSAVQAMNNLNQTMAKVFPQGNTIASSAGTSSGKYLTIQGTDGVTYKIALLANA